MKLLRDFLEMYKHEISIQCKKSYIYHLLLKILKSIPDKLHSAFRWYEHGRCIAGLARRHQKPIVSITIILVTIMSGTNAGIAEQVV